MEQNDGHGLQHWDPTYCLEERKRELQFIFSLLGMDDLNVSE
jgi:hypothetical protein